MIRKTILFLLIPSFAFIVLMLFPKCGKALDPAEPAGQAKGVPIYNSRTGQVEMVDRIVKSEAQWKAQLSAQQFQITRKMGTERAYTGKYLDHKAKGIYHCIACGTDLFDSDTKYDSKTGWPSFWEPIASENVVLRDDFKFFMRRTEVLCARCDAHLGHVFDDGPQPTGKRYCINSEALGFTPVQEEKQS